MMEFQSVSPKVSLAKELAEPGRAASEISPQPQKRHHDRILRIQKLAGLRSSLLVHFYISSLAFGSMRGRESIAALVKEHSS